MDLTLVNSKPGCYLAAPGCGSCASRALGRREFLAGIAIAAAGRAGAASNDPVRQQPILTPLQVQPVLMYEIPVRREAASWRPWGGIQTEQEAGAEKARIQRELADMQAAAGFGLEILPLIAVKTVDEASMAARGAHDVMLVYAVSGGIRTLETLTPPGKRSLIFVRHLSGPLYYWYEGAHERYLRKTVDDWGQPGMGVDDVVVDSQAEVLIRLRAFYALKNTFGKRVVAVGGAAGFGTGGRNAPQLARERWQLDIQTVSYPELAGRLQKARSSEALARRSAAETDRYLQQEGTTLETSKEFVRKAFLLTEVFRDLLDEFHTDTLTINQCMGTIMEVSGTTACLPLSILNDEGYLAFCESDFVVIPSGILLRYISGKPVFLNDPTYPHDGMVTLAHCTAPRKMNGAQPEPARILTHFESDFGAAPKVEMRKGQKVTNIVPDFGAKRWTGFAGEVAGNPFLPICRSQIEVSTGCDTRALLEQMRGFHWMTCYGDYVRETSYAVEKAGIAWVKL